MIKKLNGRPVRQQTAGGTTWVAPHHHHYHCHRALKEGQHLQTHPFQSKISIILKPKSGKKPTQILKKMTSNTLKADRAIHRVAFNPNRASSAEVLRVPVPKPNNRDVLVPGSFSFIFDSAVSAHANSYIVNNVSRALVDKLTVKFAEIIAQDNDVYDLYKFYEDLSLTENERASMFREVIQSFDL